VHNLNHGRAIVVFRERIRIHADIRRLQIRNKVWVWNKAREAHIWLKVTRPHKLFELLLLLAASDQQTAEIGPPQVVQEAAKRPDKIIHSILNSHQAEIRDRYSARLK